MYLLNGKGVCEGVNEYNVSNETSRQKCPTITKAKKRQRRFGMSTNTHHHSRHLSTKQRARTRQAFTPQQGILLQRLGGTSIGVHVTEIHFSTLLEQIITSPQDGLFVGTQIDDTIGNNDIKRSLFERVNVGQGFQISLLKVGIVKAKFVGMVGLKFSCRGQLFIRHVNARDVARRSDQLRCNVHVPSGAASQIQKLGPGQVIIGQTETTTVIFGDGRWMQLLDAVLNIRRRCTRRTTRVRLQIVGRLQVFAVIILHVGPCFVD
eukprot:scaffold4510_cov183-Amphora_coffeaeformis.AAC.59